MEKVRAMMSVRREANRLIEATSSESRLAGAESDLMKNPIVQHTKRGLECSTRKIAEIGIDRLKRPRIL
jgi:hypothetical protein